MNRLAGKTALVTGAARGLGAAIAAQFVEEGAQVIINDLDQAAADATAARLGGQAIACDVSSSTSVEAMFEQLRTLTDSLDILVNNAGISGLEGDDTVPARIEHIVEKTLLGEEVEPLVSTADVTDDEWHKMMGVHVNGTFYCSREAMKLMAAKRCGNIINISSIMGTFGRGGGTAYCTAKAAILGFTRSLAHELAPRNVRVNAIAPGWIQTDMTDPMELMKPILELQTPLGRLGDPDDIAHAAVYLASDEAKFVTGQTLSPNGGWYMSQ